MPVSTSTMSPTRSSVLWRGLDHHDPTTANTASWFPRQSRLPAATGYPLHHPGENRPDPQPQETGPAGRSPPSVRGNLHAVECGITRLKRYRAVATRYDKLAV